MLGFSPIAGATLASTGSVSVIVTITGFQLQSTLGNVEARAGADVNISGFETESFLRPVDVFGGTGVTVTVQGFEAQSSIKGVTVWGRIVPVPTEAWQDIVPSNSPTWVDIAASSSSSWQDVPENDAVPPTGAVSVTISPNDQDKVFIIKNNSTQSLVFSQGNGGNTAVFSGKSAIISCDGGGSSAAVTDITSTFDFQPLSSSLTEIAALSKSVGYAIVGSGTSYVGTNTSTDAMLMPSGTTAERPAPANGMLRYNTDELAFEGYANGIWGAIGGGGTQAGGAIVVNQQTADENYTFPSGTNGFSVGPITIANGTTVTISNGQRWVVI